MKDQRVLLTGDFWHADFKSVISGSDVLLTLVPIDKVDSLSSTTFDLVVVAQSRRDQFEVSQIEQLHSRFANIPVVALLGSWCEGEVRSGKPWPGVTRVYWHQWRGRFDAFKSQMSESEITDWHAPLTATPADRVAIPKPNLLKSNEKRCIGISAWTQTRAAMLADALQSFGWTSCWVERTNLDDASVEDLSAICIDADSWSDELLERLNWLKEKSPGTPITLVLNYPRATDIEEMHNTGVREIVSKPFELIELKSAIDRTICRVKETTS